MRKTDLSLYKALSSECTKDITTDLNLKLPEGRQGTLHAPAQGGLSEKDSSHQGSGVTDK